MPQNNPFPFQKSNTIVPVMQTDTAASAAAAGSCARPVTAIYSGRVPSMASLASIRRSISSRLASLKSSGGSRNSQYETASTRRQSLAVSTKDDSDKERQDEEVDGCLPCTCCCQLPGGYGKAAGTETRDNSTK